MKKNTNRSLRLEALEDRQMLDAAPIANAFAAEIAAQNTIVNDTIDLNAVADSSTGDLDFEAGDANKQYTMSWNAIDGAKLYNVRLSKDGGETWVTYAKPTENSVTVKGLEPGRTYSYQISGLVPVTDENGEPVKNAGGSDKYNYVVDADSGERVLREGSFSPISIASTRVTYQPTETINLVLKGSETAAASITWYALVDGDEVEIEAAADQLSYTPTTEEANYDIKVVATGIGESKGSSKDLTFRVNGDISATYDMDVHTAQISWTEVDGAASYKLRVWRPETELTRTLDDGTTETYTRPAGYIDYAKTEDTTAQVRGLYANASEDYIYKFKVIAYDEAGAPVGYRAGTFAPVSVKAAKTSVKAGDEISVVIKTAGQYSSIEWYATNDDETTSQAELAQVDEEGDSDVNLNNSQQTSYVADRALTTQNIKVVVRGSGLSAGVTAVALVSVNELQLQEPEFEPYVTVDRNIVAKWNLVDGAASYRFLKEGPDKDGNLIWKKAATISADAAVDGKLAYTVSMFDAGATGRYKVVAVNEKGQTLEEAEVSYTNFGLELDHDAYNVAGDTLVASAVAVDEGAPVDYQWFVSDDAGETWTAIDGANDASYTVAAGQSWYKVLATTEDAASVAYAKPAVVDRPFGVLRDTDDAGNLTLTFDSVEGAKNYQVEFYNANGEYPVWINLTKVDYAESDGVVTAKHVNAVNYDGCDVRVRALTEEGWSAWNGVDQRRRRSPIRVVRRDESRSERLDPDRLRLRDPRRRRRRRLRAGQGRRHRRWDLRRLLRRSDRD